MHLVEEAQEQLAAALARLDYPTLSHRDQQLKAVLSIEATAMPCPICGFAVNQWVARAAAKHFGGRTEFACACCGTELQQCVPFMSPPAYLWRAMPSAELLGVIQELNRKGYSITGRKLRDPERQDVGPPPTHSVLKNLFKPVDPHFVELDFASLDLDFTTFERKLYDWAQEEIRRNGKEKT